MVLRCWLVFLLLGIFTAMICFQRCSALAVRDDLDWHSPLLANQLRRSLLDVARHDNAVSLSAVTRDSTTVKPMCPRGSLESLKFIAPCLSCLNATESCPSKCCGIAFGKNQYGLCVIGGCCIRIVTGSTVIGLAAEELMAERKTADDSCVTPLKASPNCTGCAVVQGTDQDYIPCASGYSFPPIDKKFEGDLSCADPSEGKSTPSPQPKESSRCKNGTSSNGTPSRNGTENCRDNPSDEPEASPEEDESTNPPRTSTTEPVADGSPSGKGNDDDSKDNGFESFKGCFPGHAQVRVASGSIKRMDELVIGDRVQVSPIEFSPVFLFTHQDAKAVRMFVRLALATGEVLLATPGHYLHINGGLVMASKVRPGDIAVLGSGETASVHDVKYETSQGLYNPQTIHGDIVVNNVLASTYTTAVIPEVAHVLLVPFRIIFRGWTAAASFVHS